MKKLFVLLLALLVLFSPGNPPGHQPFVEYGKRIWHTLLLPFRLLRLGMRKADAELAMPVQGVRVRQVADTWRAPRPGGRAHQGQDIFAPRGTPVRSATPGVVIRIGEGKLGGRIVLIFGAGGRIYYYAHLDRYGERLRVADVVSMDTVIGYVGNTGNARKTPPHLHFGVYGAGGAIDPLPLLRDREGADKSGKAA
jgi:murein DD-endopeptidase MepM/ murein hydrolase activator NlpD